MQTVLQRTLGFDEGIVGVCEQSASAAVLFAKSNEHHILVSFLCFSPIFGLSARGVALRLHLQHILLAMHTRRNHIQLMIFPHNT